MKSARELFEELDFYITKEKPLTYQNDDGGYITQYLFNPITQCLQITEWEEYSNNKPQGGTTLSLEHLRAINQQINELGWNDTTVKFDVKLDGKKVIEAMRGGERTDR